ncbi:hypothetical protein BJF79_29650 [Actinomadura sp. CNU-125]|nr:hypothetical protein BJF79_29650 [Actinomadura sp. CNU-125]
MLRRNRRVVRPLAIVGGPPAAVVDRTSAAVVDRAPLALGPPGLANADHQEAAQRQRRQQQHDGAESLEERQLLGDPARLAAEGLPDARIPQLPDRVADDEPQGAQRRQPAAEQATGRFALIIRISPPIPTAIAGRIDSTSRSVLYTQASPDPKPKLK